MAVREKSYYKELDRKKQKWEKKLDKSKERKKKKERKNCQRKFPVEPLNHYIVLYTHFNSQDFYKG